MRVSSVKIHLIKDKIQEFSATNASRLLAFATVVLENSLIIYDLRVLRGDYGLFVGMPCRKVRDKCPSCLNKNIIQAKFCNYCGKSLDPTRTVLNRHHEEIRHLDVVHPITQDCRELITCAVLDAYEDKLKEVPV